MTRPSLAARALDLHAEGRSVDDIARELRLSRRGVRSLLNLTRLAPDLRLELDAGRLPEDCAAELVRLSADRQVEVWRDACSSADVLAAIRAAATLSPTHAAALDELECLHRSALACGGIYVAGIFRALVHLAVKSPTLAAAALVEAQAWHAALTPDHTETTTP